MKLFISAAFTFIITFFVLFTMLKPARVKSWEFQSVDTMKYSRDQVRDTLAHKSFEYSIDRQVSDIAKTGATHVAIDTPYDNEFLPALKIWVSAARKNNLKVYFRGNFAGWEGWFGYKKINQTEHTAKIKKFIEDNPDLFADGDVFSSCPECENGAGVNKKSDEYLVSYKQFLVSEYTASKNSFTKINKKVASNYFSMTGDFAYRIMDKETTNALGGIVVIDHYVKSPDLLTDDIKAVAEKSGGKIVLGEFGAPLPSIHGNMSDEEQTQWVAEALSKLSEVPQLVGVNYWVNAGGSTALWDDNGNPKPAVQALSKYYSK